jgi:branched-chain amino acid transport system permease protein
VSASTSTAEALDHRRDAIPERDRGRLSWPLALATVATITLVVLLPVGGSQAAGMVWLWVVAVAGVIGLNLWLPVGSWNGIVVKWASLAGGVAFLVLFPIDRADTTLTDLALFVVFAIVCIGLNLTYGFAGKVSLAQAGFLGIGAYVSVLLDTGREVTVAGFEATLPDLPFLLAIAVAGLTCMAFSVLIGFPALRVQGPWLAFVTLAFNLLVYLVINNEVGLTEGSRGLRAMRTDLVVFGVDLFETRNYYYFCLVFLLAATALVWWIVRSPWGRALKALRDNPARAASVGVDIRTYTLLAFSIGAGLAGVAGALYARLIEYIEPRAFFIGQSFDFFLATVIGGLGTLVGPFIGVSFITVLTDRLRFTGDYYRVWFGLFVVVMMLVAPKGVAGSFDQLRSWVQDRRPAAARGAPHGTAPGRAADVVPEAAPEAGPEVGT